jgi:hypothetical protein
LLVSRLADGLFPMQGDCVQVQQVVLNLVVLNAVEAMGWVEAGAREFVISTERTKMGGVLVAVRDCFGRPQGTLPVAEPQGPSISTLVAMRSSMRLTWASSGSKARYAGSNGPGPPIIPRPSGAIEPAAGA